MGTESFLGREHLPSNNTGNWKQVIFYFFHKSAHQRSFYRNLLYVNFYHLVMTEIGLFIMYLKLYTKMTKLTMKNLHSSPELKEIK